MTLAAAWLRRVSGTSELVFASDSRLTGGETWDRAQKVFLLPRTDALLCFAGCTFFALPATFQIISALDAYPPSRRRSADIEGANGHIVRVLNEMYANRDVPSGLEDPEAEFIFGGWSWRSSRFRLWSIRWSARTAQFESKLIPPMRGRAGTLCWFAGSRDAVADARIDLERMLHEDKVAPDASLDLQPLTLIARTSLRTKHPDVGGAPQVAKVYQHMNTQQFAVSWSTSLGALPRPHLAGRPLLDYEVAHVPNIAVPGI
jgi:hypothetical protein